MEILIILVYLIQSMSFDCLVSTFSHVPKHPSDHLESKVQVNRDESSRYNAVLRLLLSRHTFVNKHKHVITDMSSLALIPKHTDTYLLRQDLWSTNV